MVIRVIGVDDRRDPLLEAFGECAAGECGCPSEEFDKLASVDVVSDEDGVVLRLRAKSGETLSDSEIDACVRWTLDRSRRSRLAPDRDVGS
jgi:hypothetical protein